MTRRILIFDGSVKFCLEDESSSIATHAHFWYGVALHAFWNGQISRSLVPFVNVSGISGQF